MQGGCPFFIYPRKISASTIFIPYIFYPEQFSFIIEPALIARKRPACAEHSVARHDNRHGISSHRAAHCLRAHSRAAFFFDSAGNLAVRRRSSIGNFRENFPHPPRKIAAFRKSDGHLQRARIFSRKIQIEPSCRKTEYGQIFFGRIFRRTYRPLFFQRESHEIFPVGIHRYSSERRHIFVSEKTFLRHFVILRAPHA